MHRRPIEVEHSRASRIALISVADQVDRAGAVHPRAALGHGGCRSLGVFDQGRDLVAEIFADQVRPARVDDLSQLRGIAVAPVVSVRDQMRERALAVHRRGILPSIERRVVHQTVDREG